MKSFIEEFKTFAMRGNVIDLAVAVVIGAAFSKIVSSLVSNIITPLVGLVMGGINLTGLKVTIGGVAVTYGVFLQSIFDFIIVAFVIFLVVRTINSFEEEGKIEGKKGLKLSTEVKLLTEIRDSLKNR